MDRSYVDKRSRLEAYFDRTAHEAWTALTSDAPVSRIRQTVREGRDAMRRTLLDMLPEDLSGARVLDAGCGPGQMAVALAERGAEVTAIDLSPKLIAVAAERTPPGLRARIDYRAGDMLDPALGRFDAMVAMDSLIHYGAPGAAAAIERLAERLDGRLVFTLAPKTRLLSAMHLVGKAFPRGDRSPAIEPVSMIELKRALAPLGRMAEIARIAYGPRVSRGFYISQSYALELSGEGAA